MHSPSSAGRLNFVSTVSEVINNDLLIHIYWGTRRQNQLLTFTWKVLGQVEGGWFAAILDYTQNLEWFGNQFGAEEGATIIKKSRRQLPVIISLVLKVNDLLVVDVPFVQLLDRDGAALFGWGCFGSLRRFSSQNLGSSQLVFQSKSRLHELGKITGYFLIAIEVHMAVGNVRVEFSGSDLLPQLMPSLDADADIANCLIQINIVVAGVFEDKCDVIILRPCKRPESFTIRVVSLE